MKNIFDLFSRKLNKNKPIRKEPFFLWEIEEKFDSLRGKCFWFTIPSRSANGLLVDLRKKTLGFQKNYVPYNFTTLKFTDDCLFCKLKDRRSLQKIKFLVKTMSMEIKESSDGPKEVEKLVLTVLKIKT
jgi:hypothetical protein